MLRLPLYSRVPTTDGIEQVPCRCFLSQQRFGKHVPGSGAMAMKKTRSCFQTECCQLTGYKIISQSGQRREGVCRGPGEASSDPEG